LQIGAGFRNNTVAHEFGHMLGFNHRFNYTQSIMSYSHSRQVMAQDIDFLARQYGRNVP
jgi:predicted Zn-dependent protease